MHCLLNTNKQHKTGTFCQLLHSHEMHLLALLGLFTDRNQRFPYLTIHLLQLVKSLPFHIPDA